MVYAYGEMQFTSEKEEPGKSACAARVVSSLAVLALLLPATLQVALAQEFRPLSKGTPTSVENFVQEMFFLTKSSGSLILSGTCMATDVDKDVVGDALPHPPRGPFRDLGEAMTAVSQLDPHLSWIRDVGGLMRMSDDRVSDDVLRIHLQRVHFRETVYPDVAIRDVLSAPEVRAYFKEDHIEYGTVFNHLGPTSTKGLPGLSGDLRNVTVAEALDRVMRFFHGLWIYSECRSGPLRRVTVRGSQVGFPGAASAAQHRK